MRCPRFKYKLDAVGCYLSATIEHNLHAPPDKALPSYQHYAVVMSSASIWRWAVVTPSPIDRPGAAAGYEEAAEYQGGWRLESGRRALEVAAALGGGDLSKEGLAASHL